MKKRYRIVSAPRFITFIAVLILLTIYLTLTVSGAYNAEGLTEQTYANICVESGDTLWEIAREYTGSDEDIRVTVEKICNVNGITASTLRAGEYILVPEVL